MKKVLCLVVSFILIFLVAACSDETVNIGGVSDKNTQQESSSENDTDVESQSKINKETEEDTKKSESSEVEVLCDELIKSIEVVLEEEINDIKESWEGTKNQIDTYEKYTRHTDDIEGFYEDVYLVTETLCIKMRECALEYAELILESDMTNDDKYDELNGIYDSIYNDAGDDIYDEIYNGILDNAYDTFYNGIIEDAYEDVTYSEWSDVHSNEYDWWSDTRSDVYELWSDARSEIYEFWSDLRSEIWSGDIDDAKEVIEDFKKEINKQEDNDSSSNIEKESDTENKETETYKEIVEENNEDNNAIGSDFKKAMDNYEKFMDEYIAFMKKYNANPNDISLLTDYLDYLEKLVEFENDFAKWDGKSLNAAEEAYYIEVQTRVNKKLLDASL